MIEEQQVVMHDVIWHPITEYWRITSHTTFKCGGCKKFGRNLPNFTGPTWKLGACTVRALLLDKACCVIGPDRFKWSFCSVTCFNTFVSENKAEVLMELVKL